DGGAVGGPARRLCRQAVFRQADQFGGAAAAVEAVHRVAQVRRARLSQEVEQPPTAGGRGTGEDRGGNRPKAEDGGPPGAGAGAPRAGETGAPASGRRRRNWSRGRGGGWLVPGRGWTRGRQTRGRAVPGPGRRRGPPPAAWPAPSP